MTDLRLVEHIGNCATISVYSVWPRAHIYVAVWSKIHQEYVYFSEFNRWAWNWRKTYVQLVKLIADLSGLIDIQSADVIE